MNLIALKHKIRYFSRFKKTSRTLNDEEITNFKSKLLKSSWRLNDDVISTYPAKELYITLESLLDKSDIPFMELNNKNNNIRNNIKNVNDLFKLGDTLPLGYTLAYCNPLSNESELSSDGYDNYHAPTIDGYEFFKRRMWVSGSFIFNKLNPLKFGDILKFTETVDRIKVLSKKGTIFTDYKRFFDNALGNSVIESRRLCYLNSNFESIIKSNKPTSNDNHILPDKSITVTPTIITSFRMSAITFNSHQIHYNPDYSKEVEKYPNAVVEAPLLISLALQFWSKFNSNQPIKSFKYKITSPSFINEQITINYKKSADGANVWINNNSTICFDSTIQV